MIFFNDHVGPAILFELLPYSFRRGEGESGSEKKRSVDMQKSGKK